MNNFDDHLPDTLTFYLHSNHPIISVIWENNTLKFYSSYSFYNTEKVEMGKPEFEDWMIFWNKINKLDVWDWKEDYCYKGGDYLNGLIWHLEIEYNDKKVCCRGHNCFPPYNINRQTKIFVKMIEAFIDLGFSVVEEEKETAAQEKTDRREVLSKRVPAN